ncbi:MAG: ANTAR domain-containing response regulator [Burkholderiales bacterium]
MARESSGTSLSLRNLRSLKIVVFHPDDTDGRELLAQLERIGCRVKAYWPPHERIVEDEPDLVFLAVRPEVIGMELAWLKPVWRPPVIAVLTYENPTIIEAMLRFNVSGVIASPVKSSGLLSSIVLARHMHVAEMNRAKYVAKLEQKLQSQRKLDRAKAILMHTRGMSEDQAYKLLREQAMTKRVTTEEIADAVINANEILGFDPKPRSKS